MAEPELGLDFEVRASTAQAGPYDLIDGLNSFRRNRTSPQNSTGIFGRASKVTTGGQREVSISLGGVLIAGDAGQNTLRTAEANRTPIWIEVIYAADNDGYRQQVRVSGGEHAVDDVDGLQGITFELTPVGEPVAVGTGAVIP